MTRLSFLTLGLFGFIAGCSEQSEGPAPADTSAPTEVTQTGAGDGSPAGDAPTGTDPAYVLDHTMTLNSGASQDLSEYTGQVLLVVNTASKCGLTPQYEGLESLQQQYADQGFSVLGFPANNFMGQEPGTDEEILEFCSTRYGVSFPLFSKISVKGADQDPFYADLTGQADPLGGEIGWNFTKFLVDREGRVVARFGPRTSPTDSKVTDQIETLVAAPR